MKRPRTFEELEQWKAEQERWMIHCDEQHEARMQDLRRHLLKAYATLAITVLNAALIFAAILFEFFK